MQTKVKQDVRVGTRVPPVDLVMAERMASGALAGLKKLGYGWPVRKVREHDRKQEVTLPAYVAREMRVEAGNFVVWCCTEVPGVLSIAEVVAVYERGVDGMRILGRQVGTSKVRKSSASYEVTIPKEVQAALGNVAGESVAFMLTNYPGIVGVSVVKRPDNSTGSRRTG